MSQTIRTIYGDIQMPESESDLISRFLLLYGEWSYVETQLLATVLEANDRVWDVGAFLGTFGMGLVSQAPVRFLLAVEAQASLMPLLRNNLEVNASCPFAVAHAAVTREVGPMRPVAQPDNVNFGATSFEPAAADNQESVPGLSLRALRAVNGDYDVLKLDIEGLEGQALRGDIQYLRDRKPVIWVECNETPSSLELFSLLRWLDYHPLYVAFPVFRKNNFNGCNTRIFPFAYEAALLAAPPNRLERFSTAVTTEECIVRPLESGFDLRKALWDTPRWGQSEWVGKSKAELIACMGRLVKGQQLKTFLNTKSE
ncbi:MAG: FkbM family methyltransferase [Acidobacteriota bacterium]